MRHIGWDVINSELKLFTATQSKSCRVFVEKEPSGWYWGMRGKTVYLYKKIGDKPPVSEARRASLERARALIGTSICGGCGDRTSSDYFFGARCLDCHVSNSRVKAVQKARELLQAAPLFLDTETTGLHASDQIVEIAICDLGGNVLFDTLVKPTAPIPPEASAIHGIDDAMVASAPGWPEVCVFQ